MILSEIIRVQSGGKPSKNDMSYVDVYNEKPVRVATKVTVPVKQHPKVTLLHKIEQCDNF